MSNHFVWKWERYKIHKNVSKEALNMKLYKAYNSKFLNVFQSTVHCNK